MNQDRFIELISEKMKLIRIEKGLTQDEVAEQLGISKKTLIQIEKGRKKASWTVAVAFSTIYRDSQLLNDLLGDDPLIIIDLLIRGSHVALQKNIENERKWWQDVKKAGPYVLQENIVAGHYRVIDQHSQRRYNALSEEDAERFLASVASEKTAKS